MLNWLAGQRPTGSGIGDRDHDDAPETPAPVFAVRAFKHAIFGTPATAQPKARRNSAIDAAAGRPSFPRAIRPVMTRPKSASDAATLTAFESLPPSPTKGILLTPGTTNGRGKSVTFGDLQAEESLKEEHGGQQMADNTRRNNKAKRRTSSAVDHFPPIDKALLSSNTATRAEVGENCGRECSTIDPAREPLCSVGRYWKHEYDIYRENTADEVRKLITKQRAAKSFAREKDEQCAALTEELRHERSRVQDLERKSAELEAQIKSLKEETERLKSERNPLSTGTRLSMIANASAAETQYSDLNDQHKQDTTRLERSSIATEIRARRIDKRTGKLNAEQPLTASTSNDISMNASRALTSLQSNSVIDDWRAISIGQGGNNARQRQNEPRAKTYETKGPTSFQSSIDPPLQDTATQKAVPPIISTIERADVSTLSASHAYPLNEPKENMLPTIRTTDESTSNPISGKQILSRSGDALPPDRIAAARARLAARRQSRPNNGVRAADSG